MKITKRRIVALILFLSFFILSGCSSDTDRVQTALDKLESTEAIAMNFNMIASIDAGSLGVMDMEAHFDIKETDENSYMSMQMSTDYGEMKLEEYIIGDRVYLYCPQITDQYIDYTSAYSQSIGEGVGINMEALDFDVRSTQMEYSDRTINYQGSETNALMVVVLLDNEQLTDMIQTLLKQESASSNVLSGEDLAEAAEMYQSIRLDSAEYVLYIDDEDNVIRVLINAAFSMDVSGQSVNYEMNMQFDVLATGDSVTVEVPDIQQENVVQYETLLAQRAG